MRSVASTAMTPKSTASSARHLDAAHRHVGLTFVVQLQHRLVVHLVDVVAAENDDVVRAVALDDVDVLVHGIGGAGVPFGFRHTLRGGQDVEALVALDAEEVPAALEVTDQAVRLVLRRHADAANAGIQRVGQGEVDDARLAAEVHRGLGAPVGEFHQPAAAAAREHIGHRGPRDRSGLRDCQHALSPVRCRQAPSGCGRVPRCRRPRAPAGCRPASHPRRSARAGPRAPCPRCPTAPSRR